MPKLRKTLYTKSLGKEFKTVKQNNFIIQNADLAFYSGKSYAITGQSGSGKSTLLHMLSGMEKPNLGKIFFEGIEISILNETQAAKIRNQKIGFVFQHHHLIRELTVRENVILPAMVSPNEKKSMVQMRADWLLEKMGVVDRSHHLVGELSGGEMQRVALARALIKSPKLLFADEPTGNLDKQNARHIADILLSYAREGNATVIIATHDAEIATSTDLAYHIENSTVIPATY